MWRAALLAILQIFVALTAAALLLPLLLSAAPGLLGPTSMPILIGACIVLVFAIGWIVERRGERRD